VREKATMDRKTANIATLEEDKEDEEAEKARETIVREMQLDSTFAEFPSK